MNTWPVGYTKKTLTPMDLARLDAARDKDGLIPTVESYNKEVKDNRIQGVPIIPIGSSPGIGAE